MEYNFDKVVDRYNTDSSKYSDKILRKNFGTKDILPMWVADMDFEVAPCIIDALKKRVDHKIFGYTYHPKDYYKSIINWTSKRFGWDIKKQWILYCPGIVPAINYLIQTFCDLGDNVIIQKPVYYPFGESIKNNGCHILNNKLVLKNNKYEINFEDFEKKAKKPNTTMFILCSPHNPVSRVWTKEELTKLANICIENDVLIVSDEIHNDLVYSDYNHHMLSSLNKKFEKNTITCTAASKTFNIAGFKSSNIIIPNKSLRDKYKKTLKRHSIGLQNPLSISAVTAAYENGEKWLEELLKYLEENAKYIEKFLNENLKKAKLIKPQATYLGWIDLREYEKDGKKLESLFNTKGGVAMDGGTWFGESGNGFMRINYACPKSVLKEGLNRIKDIIIEYDK